MPKRGGAPRVGAALTALATVMIGLSTGTAHAPSVRPPRPPPYQRRRYPAHGATVVGPGESIQAAVHAADLGNTIRMFGTHRETSGTATLISRTGGSLLLSCMQASVGESRRGTPAPDGGCRSKVSAA